MHSPRTHRLIQLAGYSLCLSVLSSNSALALPGCTADNRDDVGSVTSEVSVTAPGKAGSYRSYGEEIQIDLPQGWQYDSYSYEIIESDALQRNSQVSVAVQLMSSESSFSRKSSSSRSYKGGSYEGSYKDDEIEASGKLNPESSSSEAYDYSISAKSVGQKVVISTSINPNKITDGLIDAYTSPTALVRTVITAICVPD